MDFDRVLIIAAHPDDETLGCGGLISKYSKIGAKFKVIFIAEGSSCRYDGPLHPLSVEAIAIRKSSSIRAMMRLGVIDYEFNDLPCGSLDQVPLIQINKIIEKAIRDFRPNTVFTHSRYDVNNDHRVINQSSLISTRPFSENNVGRVFSYEVLSSTEWNYNKSFSPNYFERISDEDLRCKCDALDEYFTEIKDFPFPRSKEAVKTQAMMRGSQSGFYFAEAFTLIREFKL